MPFSEKWENSYQATEHLSVWPWSTLVSLVMRFVPNARSGIKVLELGCGAGANIPFFLSINSDFYAVDGSPTVVGLLHEKYPKLKTKTEPADFTKILPFNGGFDLVFDRAALPHNNWADVVKTVKAADAAIKPGGFYIGIDWFSTSNTFAKLGRPDKTDPSTRLDMPPGPYRGIEPVRFFSQNEVQDLFPGYKMHYMEEESIRPVTPPGQFMSAWNFVLQKKGTSA